MPRIHCCDYKHRGLTGDSYCRTFVTKGPSEGRLPAVTGEAAVSLHTPALVLAEGAVAAAVAWAARSDPRGDPGSSLQVQSDAVELQGANASQEAAVSRGCPTCQSRSKWASRDWTQGPKSKTKSSFFIRHLANNVLVESAGPVLIINPRPLQARPRSKRRLLTV